MVEGAIRVHGNTYSGFRMSRRWLALSQVAVQIADIDEVTSDLLPGFVFAPGVNGQGYSG